jgi:hypothetical protein
VNVIDFLKKIVISQQEGSTFLNQDKYIKEGLPLACVCTHAQLERKGLS